MMKRMIRLLSVILLATLYAYGEPAAVIEAKANAAEKVFDQKVLGGKAFLSKVAGYLVFPDVIKGGFILGGEYGEGVLRIKGETRAYYRILSGSLGFQAGVQKRSYIIAFVSRQALEKFVRSNGWEAGVDGSIAVVNWGAGMDLSSIDFQKPIYAFVFDTKGLMYNLTLEGTKFQRIIPK